MRFFLILQAAVFAVGQQVMSKGGTVGGSSMGVPMQGTGAGNPPVMEDPRVVRGMVGEPGEKSMSGGGMSAGGMGGAGGGDPHPMEGEKGGSPVMGMRAYIDVEERSTVKGLFPGIQRVQED